MKILFVTSSLYFPQAHGGMQTAAHNLCHALMKRNHAVSVLAGFSRDGGFWTLGLSVQKKVLNRQISIDRRLGYPVLRAWCPWKVLEEAVKLQKPDLIVVMAVKPVMMALAALKTKVPVVLLLQDVELNMLGGDLRQLGSITCIANSLFTAERYRQSFGLDPNIIYPFIDLTKFKTKPTRQHITFINPYEQKGVKIALQIATACKDIPFVFVESWPLTDDRRIKLRQNLSLLPNVSFLPRQNDMRGVYGPCKILLVPSIWEEGYGMVVTEAQISGIPVIASTRGALPESVGPGGILLDPSGPIDAWISAVRSLWENDDHYRKVSEAALNHAQRKELDLAYQTDCYEEAFLAACQT